MLVIVSKRFPTLRSRTNFIKGITSLGVWEFVYYILFNIVCIQICPSNHFTSEKLRSLLCVKLFEGSYEISSESGDLYM